jgi:immunoglobulin-binding protein 1
MEDDINVKLEKIRRKIEIYEESSYDKSNEEDWKEILNYLNDLKKNVYSQGMFSDNEEFKDIITENIKFLLVPYYQGEMIQKFVENRESNLLYALKFYNEFYKLLEKYNYLTKERKEMYKNLTRESDDEENTKNSKQSFDELSKEREQKIQNFRYKKALSEKLKVS